MLSAKQFMLERNAVPVAQSVERSVPPHSVVRGWVRGASRASHCPLGSGTLGSAQSDTNGQCPVVRARLTFVSKSRRQPEIARSGGGVGNIAIAALGSGHGNPSIRTVGTTFLVKKK